MDDQSAEWVEAVRTVKEAREWVEAMRKAEGDLLQIQSRIEGNDEPDPEDVEAHAEAANRYERLHDDHRRMLESMREAWQG